MESEGYRVVLKANPDLIVSRRLSKMRDNVHYDACRWWGLHKAPGPDRSRSRPFLNDEDSADRSHLSIMLVGAVSMSVAILRGQILTFPASRLPLVAGCLTGKITKWFRRREKNSLETHAVVKTKFVISWTKSRMHLSAGES